jgi:hypothetical protein
MEDSVSIQPNDSAGKTSSNNFNRQAALYSLAAAMAGVSLLALAEPAAGEIVVTKKTIPIPISPFGTPDLVKLSVANNGIDDFSFWLYNDKAISDRGFLVAGATKGDGVIAGGDFYAKALALPRGAKIGPSADFSNYTVLIEATETGNTGRYSRGYWGENLKDHYLGVRFILNGETHYGWIRVTATIDLQRQAPFMRAKITAYAYETVANKAITAGTAAMPTAEISGENQQKQVGPSLGMLAAGAESMPLWRREESSVRP